MKNIFENNNYQYKTPYYSLLPQKVAKSAKSANHFWLIPTFLFNEFDGFDEGLFWQSVHGQTPSDGSGNSESWQCSWLSWMEGAQPHNAWFPGVGALKKYLFPWWCL